MPSFSDSIFLFILALLLFGPKRLPVLARELGKWVGEFRRASNEFKMQMEEELRLSEQADRQKTIAAMEAAAPRPPLLEESSPTPATPELPAESLAAESYAAEYKSAEAAVHPSPVTDPNLEHASESTPDPAPQPLPIATSGELRIMPPSTGLPTAYSSPLGGLLDSIPETSATAHETPTHAN